jgi:O-antigen/teichoic acid export membrane protein
MIGMPEAVVFFASRTPKRTGQYLIASLTLALASGLIFACAGWTMMPWLLRAQSTEVVMAGRVFLVVIGLYAFVGLPHQALRAIGAWHAWNALRILPSLGWLLMLLVVIWVPQWATPLMLSRLFLMIQLLVIVPIVLVLRRYVRGPYHIQCADFSPLLRYGAPTVLSILPQTLNLRVDQLLMAAFLAPQALGYYVVAVTWSNAASPIFSALGPVLFPHLSAMSDRKQQGQLINRLLPRTALCIIALTCLLLVVTPLFLPVLFGSLFQSAIPAALILVVANAFNSFNQVLGACLQGLGQPRLILVAETVGLAATFLALAVLLPLKGIIGAALASLIAYIIVSCVLFFLLRHVVKVELARSELE